MPPSKDDDAAKAPSGGGGGDGGGIGPGNPQNNAEAGGRVEKPEAASESAEVAVAAAPSAPRGGVIAQLASATAWIPQMLRLTPTTSARAAQTGDAASYVENQATAPAPGRDLTLQSDITGKVTHKYTAPSAKPPLPPGLEDDSDVSASTSVCGLLTFEKDYESLGGAPCSLCQKTLMSVQERLTSVRLKNCGHAFHFGCIKETVKRSGCPNCPQCRASVLLDPKDHWAHLRGNSPSGDMKCFRNSSHSCAGYEGCGSIVITYSIPMAVQQKYHPNAGETHCSVRTIAYLPDNREGHALLCRLKAAFLCGLSFDVTDGNVVNGIWHKTVSAGGGLFGFPDVRYFAKVNEELDGMGVPEAKVCAEYVVPLEQQTNSQPSLGQGAKVVGRRQANRPTAHRTVGASASGNPMPGSPVLLTYDAPPTKPLPPGLSPGSDIFDASSSICRPLGNQELGNVQCKICLEHLVPASHDEMAVGLEKCGHGFHLRCIRETMRHQCSLKCPECRESVLLSDKDHFVYLRGNMPSGQMTCYNNPNISCAGFEGCGSIVITYTCMAAVQKGYHPNPGQRHGSATRTAYLPYNEEGRDLLCRLKAAFLCGLTFTIGTSLTTNRENSVTWASIHHKTAPSGGITCHGFPDANYLSNCNGELDRAGVPPAKACADHVAKLQRQLPASSLPSLMGLPQKETVSFYKEKVRSLKNLPSAFKEIHTDDFTQFVESCGLKGPNVEENPHLLNSDMYTAFVEEGNKCNSEHDIRIVFHGTPEANIESILRNGLDPALRNVQVYGQGEYFATSPELPLSYCRGGKKMLVFAVMTRAADVKVRNIVLVNKRERQLPIATLSFDGFDQSALAAANIFQAQVKKLWQDMKEKEKVVKEIHRKEKIVRLLLAGEYLSASDIYQNACDADGMPPESWAKEVATYVWDHVREEDQIGFYFPNLPARPTKSDDIAMLNSDKCEREATEAKQKWEMASGRKK